MPEPTTTQPQDETRLPEDKAIHWLVVGYISDGARAWVESLGGRVLQLSATPSLIAVGLFYDKSGAWVWSHGKREHRQGIEYWSQGEIQEASTGITLIYRHMGDYTDPAYCSMDTNYLILPDEVFDPKTGRVKEPSDFVPMPKEATGTAVESLPQQTQTVDDEGLEEIEDHPF